MQRDCALSIADRGRLTWFVEYKTGNQSLFECTKCPKFPKPRLGYPIENRNNKKAFTSNNVVEGISFASMVSGKSKNNDPQPTNTNSNNSERQSHPNTLPTDEINSSDFQDLLALFKIVSNIFKQFPKLKQIIP
ncbi:hypothetical protein TNCV_4864111 [Trichonephila clavipes]|nr:hypothetical protein TNCV_4864111 [Trichonephila clavipes]